jgi:hypothetical protein
MVPDMKKETLQQDWIIAIWLGMHIALDVELLAIDVILYSGP